MIGVKKSDDIGPEFDEDHFGHDQIMGPVEPGDARNRAQDGDDGFVGLRR